MGRHRKELRSEQGLDRRQTGYYSTPDFVSQYLTERMLAIQPLGKRVLDPCIGKEEMCRHFAAAGCEIVGFDLVDYGVHQAASFEQRDFIEYYLELKDRHPSPVLPFDYFIANPPYNCHEVEYIRSNKLRLQSYFGPIGTLNMYSLFLAALVDLAPAASVIGVITSDSFLTNRLHAPLRNLLVEHCHIHDLILCPTDLFRQQKADVRTCLLVLQKKPAVAPERIRTLGRPAKAAMLRCILAGQSANDSDLAWTQISPEQLALSSQNDYQEWVIDCPEEIRKFFAGPRLGDHFVCVSGISTGNDRKYLRGEPAPGWEQPFYKNPGKRRFFSEPDGYLPDHYQAIGAEVSNFLLRNRQHLGKEGIACSSMGVAFGACYRPAGTLFGVNGNFVDLGEDLWWLLAYLNSSLVTYFLRGVLLRSNIATSGYVRRIPMVPLTAAAKQALAKLATLEYDRRRAGQPPDSQVIADVDRIMASEIHLPAAVQNHVADFCQNLVQRT